MEERGVPIPHQDCHLCLTEARCAPLGKCRAVPLTTVPEQHQSRMTNGQPSPAVEAKCPDSRFKVAIFVARWANSMDGKGEAQRHFETETAYQQRQSRPWWRDPLRRACLQGGTRQMQPRQKQTLAFSSELRSGKAQSAASHVGTVAMQRPFWLPRFGLRQAQMELGMAWVCAEGLGEHLAASSADTKGLRAASSRWLVTGHPFPHAVCQEWRSEPLAGEKKNSFGVERSQE